MEITGKLIHRLDVQTGVSKAGKEWQKQDFVIETEDGQYSKKIAFTLFGDKISLLNGLNKGDTIIVAFNLESREFDGKWFSNVNAWKITPVQGQPEQSHHTPPQAQQQTPAAPPPPSDDLPF